MKNHNSQNIKIFFNESKIGWIVLIIGLFFSAGVSIAVGSILAAINWFRLGQKAKALWSLGIGLSFAVLFLGLTYIWKIQNPIPSTLQLILSVIIQGVLILFAIAITEKLLRANIAHVHNTGLHIETYSVSATLGVAILSILVLLGMTFFAVFGVELFLTPKVKTTSNFISGGNQSVIGSISAWSNEPTADRQVALCQLTGKKPLSPYECIVTNSTATTDENGEFQIKSVPVGKYLIIYNAGLTDFKKGLEIWHGKELKPGDLSWTLENYKQLYNECGSDASLVIPDGSSSLDFYYYKTEYVFTQCGSYFFLAHDINTAITYKEENPLDPLKQLPDGVFNPVVIEVMPNNDSFVKFNVLYARR